MPNRPGCTQRQPVLFPAPAGPRPHRIALLGYLGDGALGRLVLLAVGGGLPHSRLELLHLRVRADRQGGSPFASGLTQAERAAGGHLSVAPDAQREFSSACTGTSKPVGPSPTPCRSAKANVAASSLVASPRRSRLPTPSPQSPPPGPAHLLPQRDDLLPPPLPVPRVALVQQPRQRHLLPHLAHQRPRQPLVFRLQREHLGSGHVHRRTRVEIRATHMVLCRAIWDWGEHLVTHMRCGIRRGPRAVVGRQMHSKGCGRSRDDGACQWRAFAMCCKRTAGWRVLSPRARSAAYLLLKL